MKSVHVSKCYTMPNEIYLQTWIYYPLSCNLWRERNSNIEQEMISDIYDGRVWKSLHCINEEPFLSEQNNWCLALNVDWFNPFKQTPYSVGAMYLSILNLPRAERF